MTMTFDAAVAAIWERSGYDRGFISNPFAGDDAARAGLIRTQLVLDQLGRSTLPYPIVHVAGSKGKGSTCVMIDAMCREAGVRTGRYLSPHLYSFRERFVVNDELISEADFGWLTERVIAAAEVVEARKPWLGQVTAFELSTAMALDWFAVAQCELIVLEVGLGGELDATNVVMPAVSVITTLDFEHVAILGPEMADIARNKAGIIKAGHPVVSAAQPDDGMAVIGAKAAEMRSPLFVADRDWTVSGSEPDFAFSGKWGSWKHLAIGLTGRHQLANAGLAIAAVQALSGLDLGIVVDDEAMKRGLATASIPGRFQEVTTAAGQLVVIDGAHTPASAAALAQTLKDRFAGKSLAIVIGMLSDKDPHVVITPLRDVADRWVVVRPESPRALSADAIVSAIGGDFEIAGSVAEGIAAAAGYGVDVVVVTGSLTTAAEAIEALGHSEQ